MSVTILGIESSCDDTGAAVIRDGVLLSNVTASQKVHEAYGGVVPELASRAHQQNIVPVVSEALRQAGVKKEELSAVCVTLGPGLMGSLLVGVSFAKGFAASLGIPLIEANHLQGHVLAHFISSPLQPPPSGGGSQMPPETSREVQEGFKTASPDRYELLKGFAKENKKHATPAEAALWEMLRDDNLGMSFRRQHIIGDYIVDFVCLSRQLCVEVDGGYHAELDQKEHDEQRTKELEKMGFRVIRFSNEEVIADTHAVLEKITAALNTSPGGGRREGAPPYPFLCLLVSGGNSQIVRVNAYNNMEILGQTIDDAAGEAMDKCSKVMGFGYPGGPIIDRLARQGNPDTYQFSKPNIAGLDYSFSGLKTSFLYFLRDREKEDPQFVEHHKEDLAASLEKTIVDILMKKLKMAVKQTGIKHVALSGGVSANTALRQAFLNQQQAGNWKVYIPPFSFTTDNAAMIAVTGYYKYLDKDFCPLDKPAYSRVTI